MMPDAGAVGNRWLGRADVQAAIHLHGIHRNDFAAQLFGQEQGDFRFTNRSRTGQQ